MHERAVSMGYRALPMAGTTWSTCWLLEWSTGISHPHAPAIPQHFPRTSAIASSRKCAQGETPEGSPSIDVFRIATTARTVLDTMIQSQRAHSARADARRTLRSGGRRLVAATTVVAAGREPHYRAHCPAHHNRPANMTVGVHPLRPAVAIVSVSPRIDA